MNRRRFLWLSVPALGLIELAAHAYFSTRAPEADAWRKLRPALNTLRKRDELVVVAPAWADPLARRAFGDSLMPLAQVARPDLSAFGRAIEVSSIGARASELETWRVIQTEGHGDFALRVLENPSPARIEFSFLDALSPERVTVRQSVGGAERACPWNAHANVTAGGLGAAPASPRQRFECSAPVGITVIDDERYQPRRCLWAQPAPGGKLVVRYQAVPIGDSVYGYTGVPWLMARDGIATRVELETRVGGASIGTAVHPKRAAWIRFEFRTANQAGTSADVEFEVRASPGERAVFCFYADTRWLPRK